jgi:Recombination endonuclease VII
MPLKDPEARKIYEENYRDRHLELMKKRAAERYRTDEDFRRTQKRRHILRKYGITLEQYEASIVSQGNCCAICHEIFTTSPDLDHSHTTGQLRKFLCRSCNMGLGQFRDSVDLLLAAAEYLKGFERQPDENI